MRLWLDDVRPAPSGWVLAKNCISAIELAQAFHENGEFEACSLDHDLGEGYAIDGIQFVDWMVENNIWPFFKPIVHSMNPVGRKRMEMTINRYFPD